MNYENGRYQALITDQNLVENNKGNPELQLSIQPTAYQNEYGEWIIINVPPRTIFLTLTDKTIGTPESPGWVLGVLHYLGWRGTSFDTLDKNTPGHHVFDNEIEALCNNEEWEGRTREKWSIATPRTGKGLPKSSLKQLSSRHKATLAAMSKKPSRTQPIMPVATATPIPAAIRNIPSHTPSTRLVGDQDKPTTETDVPF